MPEIKVDNYINYIVHDCPERISNEYSNGEVATMGRICPGNEKIEQELDQVLLRDKLFQFRQRTLPTYRW